jgi:hypothetical protein
MANSAGRASVWEMQNVIAAVMLILGTLLVLAGVAVIVAKAILTPDTDPGVDLPSVEVVPGAAPPTHPRTRKLLRTVRRIEPSDRLIAWGVVLLLLAAVASGMISFNLGASATSK